MTPGNSDTTPKQRTRTGPIQARYIQAAETEYVNIAEGFDEQRGALLPYPGPPEVQTERVCHYTDAAGLIGIMRQDCIWATTARMLNDTQELDYGRELFDDSVVWLKEQFDIDNRQAQFIDEVRAGVTTSLENNDLYVACASKNGDDLGQWRGYAGGSGYSIAIDPYVALAVCKPDSTPDLTALVFEPMVEWREVVYVLEDQIALMRSLARFVAAMTPSPTKGPEDVEVDRRRSVATVLESVARLKHPGFESEQEVRLVIGSERFRPLVEFRAGILGPTPYLSMAPAPEHPAGAQVVATAARLPLPVLEIKIGPAQDQDTARSGVTSLLRTLGRSELDVSLAKIPYR